MLVWIFLVLAVIFVIAAGLTNDFDFQSFFECMCVINIVIFIIVGGIALVCNVGADGEIAYINTERASLVYQYENNLYDNDNDLGKKELMDQIQEWNADLASNKENQDDFWIGAFIPNIYDQFEPIDIYS